MGENSQCHRLCPPFLPFSCFLCVVAPLLLTARAADAQVAQSFDELAIFGLLNSGDKVQVRDSSGPETSGVFSEFRGGSLVLLTSGRGGAKTFSEAEVQRIRRRGGHAVVWGAAIGGAAALLATSGAASTYGENEGGEYCGRCMVQWSSFTVPVGVAAGAAVGVSIDRARRSILYLAPRQKQAVFAIPFFSRRGAEVLIAARF